MSTLNVSVFWLGGDPTERFEYTWIIIIIIIRQPGRQRNPTVQNTGEGGELHIGPNIIILYNSNNERLVTVDILKIIKIIPCMIAIIMKGLSTRKVLPLGQNYHNLELGYGAQGLACFWSRSRSRVDAFIIITSKVGTQIPISNGPHLAGILVPASRLDPQLCNTPHY